MHYLNETLRSTLGCYALSEMRLVDDAIVYIPVKVCIPV